MLPKALSAAEKLLMRGINPSVKNIQQFTQTANSLNTKGINKTGRLVKSVGKLFLGFIAFWVFVVIVAFSVATIAFYFGVGNIDWLNHLFNITFTDKSVLWAGKIGVLLCVLIPLITLLLILLKLIFHIKNNIRVWLLSLTVMFICGVGFLMYAVS